MHYSIIYAHNLLRNCYMFWRYCHHLQGADTKISLKHTAVKKVKKYMFLVTYFIAVCFKEICFRLPVDGKIIEPKHVGNV